MDLQKIRVAILDDNAKFRNHLVKLLGKQPEISVVTSAETGLAGINEIEAHKPDVILMGKINSFTDGLEATEMIVSRFPDTRVIILSMDSKSTMAASSCQTWACYPRCENCTDKEILAAIREGYQPKNGSAPKSIGQSNSINQ
jgi:two-component system response regulator DegU